MESYSCRKGCSSKSVPRAPRVYVNGTLLFEHAVVNDG